jgi:hypothetical protein
MNCLPHRELAQANRFTESKLLTLSYHTGGRRSGG